jgi:probable HAF family extracellular repeat protein
MTRFLRLVLAVLLSTLVLLEGGTSATVVAQAPPPEILYTVTSLGTLGGDWTIAQSINDSGQITGRTMAADQTQHAFSWTAGVMTDLGQSSTGGVAINNAGQIAGNAPIGLNGSDHAVLWTSGQRRDLGTLGGPLSQATGLNNPGQVVGYAYVSNSIHAGFLWQNGVMTRLDSSNPVSINDAGHIASQGVGANGQTHAFVRQGGVVTALGTLGGPTSQPTAINNAGQVVGVSDTPTGPRGFVWQDGVMSALQSLGGSYDFPRDLNDAGTAVGFANDVTYESHAVIWRNGGIRRLNDLIDPASGWVLLDAMAINTAGQIVGYGQHHGQFESFLLTPVAHRPVLIIPGIGGTYASDTGDLGAWMFERGLHPDGMQIDPLAHAYDDLIATLKDVGYVEGKDLFVVKYDWRVPVGPADGVFDGVVNGLTAQSIADQSFNYAVDYLGYYLRQAMDAWAIDHPNTPLDKVDIVAHSTGGLVARTYIQSPAYGATLTGDKKLPQVDQFVMIGVPNRGASKPWNTLQDNWGVDISFQLVLSKMLNMGYQKVQAGATIIGPDQDISLASLAAPACQDSPELCFIRQYNPTARSLLATYDFIDFGNGFTNVNSNPAFRNNLVLDLNAGLDLSLTGDPNAFTDHAEVTVIYGTSVDTPTAVIERVGTAGGEKAIVRFSDFVARDARPGEVWYDDIIANQSGDGTVPLDSSAGQFFGDSRVTLKPFTRGANTQEDVSHLGLMYNADVQKEVLRVLGASFTDDSIWTTEHEAWAPLMSTAVNVAANILGGSILGAILDPVEGFVVDGQGRRLGYSAATGPVTEIPGSMWFGNTDGIGWVMEPLVEPLSLQLAGLGGSFYTMVSVVNEAGGGGRVDQGTLAAGSPLAGSIPTVVTAEPSVTPGDMAGDGFIRDDNARYQFSFRAVETDHGERARLTVRIDNDGRKKDSRPARAQRRDDRFVSKTVTSIAFSDDPSVRRANHPQVDTVLFAGVGEWNGQGGYRYEAFAQDDGTPGRHRETIRVTVSSPAGAVVAAFDGELDGGSIRSRRIKH